VGTAADQGGAARSNSPTAALKQFLGCNKTLRRQFATQESPVGEPAVRWLVHDSAPTGPFRRAQWAPVRIEVELRKLQAARPELGRLVPLATGSGGGGHHRSGSGGSYEMVGDKEQLPALRLAVNGDSGREHARPASP